MGTDDTDRQILETLRELRDGQRELIRLIAAQQALAQEQFARSRETVTEPVGMQRVALQRQKMLTLFAVPGILLCMAAIAYLLIRYL